MYPHERSLVERLKDQPFAIVGINSDQDREYASRRVREEGLSWRSFWNGPKGTRGPISAKWNVRGWPSLFLIDAQGVIRADSKTLRRGMDEAIDALLAEMASGAAAEAKPEQAAVEAQRLKLVPRFVPAKAKAGDTVVLELKVSMIKGYHVYGAKDIGGSATSLTIRDPGGLSPAGEPEVPPGEPHESFGMVGYWLDGEFVIRQRFTVPTDSAGAIAVQGSLNYMACDELSCDPPNALSFTATLQVDDSDQ